MTDSKLPRPNNQRTQAPLVRRSSLYVPMNRAVDDTHMRRANYHTPAVTTSRLSIVRKKIHKIVSKIVGVTRKKAASFRAWWRGKDKRYGIAWRGANVAAALLILSSVLIPVISQLNQGKRYKLSSETLGLVGSSNGALASKLTYDSEKKLYQFNKDAVKEFNPVDQLKAQVGGSGEKDKNLYSLDVHQDMAKGVTYYDTNSQLNFTLKPQFDALPGKVEQQRLVYPMADNAQAVYTLKNNGLKEDIVVQKATKDSMSFSYILELPKTLEAKAMPDRSGAIGIYSASPTLFGNISYGSDTDRASVEKARENATKDTLVFGIPAPVITKSTADKGVNASARFVLDGNKVTVIAEGLSELKQPFSIDPSVVITSSSDFITGNNEGNIDFSTSGQINRAGVTGGEVNRIASDTSCGVANTWCTVQTGTSGYNGGGTGGGGARQYGLIANNGFLYGIGGNFDNNSQSISTVSYASLNASNGSVGSWTVGSTLVGGVGLSSFGSAIYNGYLYVIGGSVQGSGKISTIQYALICTGSNSGQGGCGATVGSVGTWTASTTSTNFGTVTATPGVTDFAAVAYNGYMYTMGGIRENTNVVSGDVLYAPILPNGDLGAWAATTSLPGSNLGTTTAAVYNGRIYLGVSCGKANGLFTPGSCTNPTTLFIGDIASNGTISGWRTGPTYSVFGTQRSPAITAAKGYLYVSGGIGSVTTVTYAPIYADGSVGTAKTTSPLSVAVSEHRMTFHNGYLYVLGGNPNVGSTATTDTQYAKIDDAGAITSYASNTSTVAATGIAGAATVAYNGYMYVLGGDNGANLNSVSYAAINANGSIGTTGNWATTSAFTNTRYSPGAVAYNGYMYILGGRHTAGNCGASGTQYCDDVQYATINANGTLGAWASAGGVYSTTARSALGVMAYNGYLYAIGGDYNNNSLMSDEVDYAPINANGTIGTWVTSTTVMNTGHSRFGIAAYGNYVYIVGGRSTLAGNVSNATVYGTIASSGDITTWTVTASFATARQALSSGVYNGYLYLTGGSPYTTGIAGFQDTQYSRINSDGSLAGWSTLSATYTTTRSYHGTTIYNGYIYIIGGCSNISGLNLSVTPDGCSTYQNDVQYAQINNNSGTTGTWTNQSNAGAGRAGQGSVTYNGYLYVVGGCTATGLSTANACSSITSDVSYATIGTDGTTGTFNATTALPVNNRGGLTSLAYNGYIYAVGGCLTSAANACTSFASDVLYAPICDGVLNTNGCTSGGGNIGKVGTWASAGASFTTGRFNHSAVINNGYMYIMGGCSAMGGTQDCTAFQNDVQFIQLNSNGTLNGSWASAGATIPGTGRYGQSTVVYNNTMYVMGGCSTMSSGNCTTILDDVQSIALNTNGTLNGSWASAGRTPMARYGSSVIASNGYIFLVGGCTANSGGNCTGNMDDVQRAPVISNGLLGEWNGAIQHFSGARFRHTAVIANGYIVILGGNRVTNNFVSQTQSASLQVQPQIGSLSKLVDLGIRSNVRGISYGGSLPGALNAISYKAGLSAASAYTTSGTASISSLTNARCTGINSVRYLLLLITIDDSQRATFPDTNTIPSNVTDVTVLYEPSRAPNQRLRLGQTLQAGVLSELDICKI